MFTHEQGVFTRDTSLVNGEQETTYSPTGLFIQPPPQPAFAGRAAAQLKHTPRRVVAVGFAFQDGLGGATTGAYRWSQNWLSA